MAQLCGVAGCCKEVYTQDAHLSTSVRTHWLKMGSCHTRVGAGIEPKLQVISQWMRVEMKLQVQCAVCRVS